MTTADATTGSVPLITLPTRRRNYSPLGSDHFDDFDLADTSYHGGTGYNTTTTTINNDNESTYSSPYQHQQQHRQQQQHSNPFIDSNDNINSKNSSNNMARGRQQLFATLRPRKGSNKSAFSIISSYIFDWCIIIAILGVAYYLNNKAPNRRPFSLEDPNIS